MRGNWQSVVLVLLVSAVFSTTAMALPQIDFGVFAPTTGAIKYAGGANPLTASNLSIDNVIGLGTPSNDAVLRNCVACTMSFATGNFAGSVPSIWAFSGGGNITLVGGVDLNNDGDATDPGDIPVGTTLLSGTFTGGAIVLALGRTFRIAGGAFVDVKNATLAAFYGLPGGNGVPYDGFFNLSFIANTLPPNAFTSAQVLSGDVIDQTSATGAQTAQLPSTALLMGLGLVSAAWTRRRTRNLKR